MLNNIVDAVVQGILLGGLYGLYAAGLSLVFGIMRLVNLAHGDFIILAAFLILAFQRFLSIGSPFAMLLVVVPVMFILGYVLQRFVLNPVLGRDILRPILVTFGLSVIIQNGLLQSFTADSRKLHGGIIELSSFTVPGGVIIGYFPITMLAVCLLTIGGLQWMLFHTRMGIAFRATSDDPSAAGLMGVNTRHLFSIATGVVMATVAIASVFTGIRASFAPTSGSDCLLYAFEAIIIGGLGSLWGTLIGGMILAVSQSLGSRVSPAWQMQAGHLIFLIVLLTRPQGLFPRRLDN